ncbi:MAG: NAD-dependent epimerase/dehydratase family protein [Bacteroidales bacterium]|nr:NAD-dependent epimerase/dehydratase family protein [Bacteroidales bacterium]
MILLLGASGFLGHNLLNLLLRQGRKVRIVLRDGASIDRGVLECASAGQLNVIRGSILSDSVLEQAVSGCSSVVNCAGVTDMSLPSPEDYRPVNALLPLRLAQLLDSRSGGVLVDVSTSNTVDPGTAGNPSNEDTPFGGPFSASLYARSKLESEKLLADFASTHLRTRIVIILPGFMVGPYDRKPSSGKLLDAAYRKPLMAVPRGGKSFVDVRDVAAAIANAIDDERASGRFLATGQAYTFKDFYAIQARVCGYRQKCFTLPAGLCISVGKVFDRIERKGRRVVATSRNIRQLLVEEYYDNTRARTRLNMPRTPLEQSIKDYFDYAASRR